MKKLLFLLFMSVNAYAGCYEDSPKLNDLKSIAKGENVNVTANTWLKMDGEMRNYLSEKAQVIDGTCAPHQIIDGDIATTEKLIIPFNHLLNLYAYGIENQDREFLTNLSQNTVVKRKSLTSWVGMYAVAPTQGWEMATRISKLLGVPKFTKDHLQMKKKKHALILNMMRVPKYTKDTTSGEPSANYLLLFTFLALGGEVDQICEYYEPEYADAMKLIYKHVYSAKVQEGGRKRLVFFAGDCTDSDFKVI